MKTILLAALTLTIAFEASAQHNRRGGPSAPGRSTTRDHRSPAPVRSTTTVRDHRGPGRSTTVIRDYRNPPPVVVRTRSNRYRPVYTRPIGPIIRVQPRYVRNPYSQRYIRTVVRPPIIWSTPFGYSCDYYDQLTLNGSFIHNFDYTGECQQAIQDIRIYGDFCDGEDLYDQTGVLEAQFSFSYECRDNLGYYY